MPVEKHTTAAFPTLCEGVGRDGNVPLRYKPAHATVTVYSDGSRDVGCGFLNRTDGSCKAAMDATNTACIQLFPGEQARLILPQRFSFPKTIAEGTTYQATVRSEPLDGPPPGKILIKPSEENRKRGEPLDPTDTPPAN